MEMAKLSVVVLEMINLKLYAKSSQNPVCSTLCTYGCGEAGFDIQSDRP